MVGTLKKRDYILMTNPLENTSNFSLLDEVEGEKGTTYIYRNNKVAPDE